MDSNLPTDSSVAPAEADPLAKLMQIVGDNNAQSVQKSTQNASVGSSDSGEKAPGQVDQIQSEQEQVDQQQAPKKLYVLQKPKLANDFVNTLVATMREQQADEAEILDLILKLDEKIEAGEITNTDFMQLEE